MELAPNQNGKENTEIGRIRTGKSGRPPGGRSMFQTGVRKTGRSGTRAGLGKANQRVPVQTSATAARVAQAVAGWSRSWTLRPREAGSTLRTLRRPLKVAVAAQAEEGTAAPRLRSGELEIELTSHAEASRQLLRLQRLGRRKSWMRKVGRLCSNQG